MKVDKNGKQTFIFEGGKAFQSHLDPFFSSYSFKKEIGEIFLGLGKLKLE